MEDPFFSDILAEMVLAPVSRHPRAPQMPPDDYTNSKLHCIPVTPRAVRHLQHVMPIPTKTFKEDVDAYLRAFSKNIIDHRDRRRFMLPDPAMFVYPSRLLMDEDTPAYTNVVFKLVCNLLAVLEMAMPDHSFASEKADPLHCGWSNFNWGRANESEHRLSDVKLVTVTMPMWCFANKDMLDFCSKQEFVNPASLAKEGLENVSASTRLWARLHDYCFCHDAHYFVITTYNQWIFGAFSAHWTTGFATQPMKFDAANPNVVQTLLFWMHSSYGHPKGYKITKVSERPDFVEHPLRYCHQSLLNPLAARRLACCS